MRRQKIYIKAASQISMQSPLNEDWMKTPIQYNEPYVRSVEPNFRDFINPSDARRMGKILKRALTTSLTVIQQSGIEHPDAIITGTGLGCIENTELFLEPMCKEGEHLLKPTPFMQSTHNTISSLIAIYTKCHGYNATYSHQGISFESALLDAWLQFQLGKINSALIGGHDELTPSWFRLLKKINQTGSIENGISSETAVSFMLDNHPDNSWCEVAGIKILHQPTMEILRSSLDELLQETDIELSSLDGVVTGINGNPAIDKYTEDVTNKLFGHLPLIHYKHLFGESYTSCGLGMYVAACCLKYQTIPTLLYYRNCPSAYKVPHYILLFNQSMGTDYSFILLKSLCGKSFL